MKIAIIEDELPATNALISVLKEIDPAIVVEQVIKSASELRQFLENYSSREIKPDLLFMDIQLKGENSLQVLEEFRPPVPIIFVTAFDEYIMRAMEHTSLDYVLKPISREKIERAMEKYNHLKEHFNSELNMLFDRLKGNAQRPRTRFLVKKGYDYQYIKTEDIALFYSDHKLIFLIDFENKRHISDFKKLDQVEEQIDPKQFFKLNRKMVVNINAIKKFKPVDKVKLLVELTVTISGEAIVSQDNATAFKNWIEEK